MDDKWKFYIATFGCKINQYESGLARQEWSTRGGVETDNPAAADVIMVNSCAITSRAERDARNAIARLRKIAPSARIILTGCAAQFYESFHPRKDARLILPDMCVPQSKKARLLLSPDFASNPDMQKSLHLDSYWRTRPVIKMQDGCSHRCTYCIVPQTRGKPTSRPVSVILEECRALAAKGYGELILSGVNLRQYESDFWDVLHRLDKCLADEFENTVRLRISSLDPSMLNERAIGILLESSNVCKYLHLSLQHVSPKILSAMGRSHYTAETVARNLEVLVDKWGVMGLGADFIMGFPRETEEDVEAVLQYVRDVPFTSAHVFPYSRRPGTRAASFHNQIPRCEKERRAGMLRRIAREKHLAFLDKQIALAEVVVAPEELIAGRTKGMNEYNTPCLIMGDVPRQRGLVPCIAVGVAKDKLIVEPVGHPTRGNAGEGK